MGTDIHVIVEKKKNNVWDWEKVDIDDWLLPKDRNYELFGFLSGIRDSSFDNFMLDDRWPDDTSIEEYAHWHNLGHSYLLEINRFWIWPESLKDCYFRIFCRHIIPRISELENVDQRHIRILVAYDS